MRTLVLLATMTLLGSPAAADLRVPAAEPSSATARSLLTEVRLVSMPELKQLKPADWESLRQALEAGDFVRQAVLAWPIASLDKEQGLQLLTRVIEGRTRAPNSIRDVDFNNIVQVLKAIGYIAQTSDEAAKYLSGLLGSKAWCLYRGSAAEGELDRLLAAFSLRAYAISVRPDVAERINEFVATEVQPEQG